MGQKANPKSLRLKIGEEWKSRWYKDKEYGKLLIEDITIRQKIFSELKNASISDVIINRDANQISVMIYAARPGVLIGRGGAGSEKIKKMIEKITKSKVKVDVYELKKPDSNARCLAENVVNQIEKRIPFRRAIKSVVQKARESGVYGVRIRVSGRLNGADIARSEKSTFGTIPLSTLNKDIDFACVTALTTYGIIGVKVWVYQHSGKKEKEAA